MQGKDEIEMIRNVDIFADMHVHTLSSEHAYSTLKECIDCARNCGLKFLAITDHFYNDGTELNKKNEIARLQHLSERANSKKISPYVFSGAEFNIGHAIPNRGKLECLDWKMVGLHGWVFNRESISLNELFDLFCEQADWCDVFSHIERGIHRIDNCKHGINLDVEVKEFLNKIVDFAKRRDIILEVNESSLNSNEKGEVSRLKYWLSLAKQNQNKISLGTDAHYCEEVGDFTKVIGVLNEVEYPPELILNCNPSMLEKKFNIATHGILGGENIIRMV